MGCRFSIKVHSGKRTPIQRKRKGSQTATGDIAPSVETDTDCSTACSSPDCSSPDCSSPDQIEIKSLEKKLEDIKKLEKEKEKWKP